VFRDGSADVFRDGAAGPFARVWQDGMERAGYGTIPSLGWFL
jgi:hypothetical protein